MMAFLPVVRQIRRWQADLIITNTCTVSVGAFAAYVLRKPHVWYIHEFGKEDHGITYDIGIRMATRVISWMSDVVLVNSRAVQEYYARYIAPERLRRVDQAVTVEGCADEVRPLVSRGQTRPLRLVQIGRVEEGKGQMDSVLALGYLIRSGLLAELTLQGPGEPGYLARVRETIAQQGLEPYVRLPGYAGDVASIIRAADIILVCSRAEAFGRVTIEAMKLGKPVVGARSGATPDLIEENFNGVLYTPGDHRELAGKIELLIRTPGLTRQMTENACRWAREKFSLKQYAEQVFKVLTAVVGESRGQSPG